MINVYAISIEPKAKANIFGSGRTIYVLTDSIQNAMSIGKTRCGQDEEVIGVRLDSSDLVIDYQAVNNNGQI